MIMYHEETTEKILVTYKTKSKSLKLVIVLCIQNNYVSSQTTYFEKLSADEMLRFGIMLQHDKDSPGHTFWVGTPVELRRDSNVLALRNTEA